MPRDINDCKYCRVTTCNSHYCWYQLRSNDFSRSTARQKLNTIYAVAVVLCPYQECASYSLRQYCLPSITASSMTNISFIHMSNLAKCLDKYTYKHTQEYKAKQKKVYSNEYVQGLSFIMSQRTATLSHRKPASAEDIPWQVRCLKLGLKETHCTCQKDSLWY